MSFRIENILKKDTEQNTPQLNKGSGDSVREDTGAPRSVDDSRYGSILHQTLLNRLHPTYSRSVSEGYVDKVSSSCHAYGCERVCFPQSYYNPYFDNDYPHIYTRSRFYPIYSTSFPSMMPLQYSYYSKRKGGQVRFTANQTDVLEKRFLSHKYLSPEDRKLLANDLKLSDRQVKTWFQNRRAKWRRSSTSSIEHSSIDNEQIKTQNGNFKTIH